MTHEELLKKIYSMELRYANEKPRREALRAVVELHKPYPTKRFGIICKECEISTDYPCATIQAIDKELA